MVLTLEKLCTTFPWTSTKLTSILSFSTLKYENPRPSKKLCRFMPWPSLWRICFAFLPSVFLPPFPLTMWSETNCTLGWLIPSQSVTKSTQIFILPISESEVLSRQCCILWSWPARYISTPPLFMMGNIFRINLSLDELWPPEKQGWWPNTIFQSDWFAPRRVLSSRPRDSFVWSFWPLVLTFLLIGVVSIETNITAVSYK